MNVLVINGPNLSLLGLREPEIYGTATLDFINDNLNKEAAKKGVELTFFQSDIEGEIVNFIGKHINSADAIIINPAAYTHTSIAISDALKAFNKPTIEVHLTNIYKREKFRQHSYTSPVATGVISGLGKNVYKLALLSLFDILGV